MRLKTPRKLEKIAEKLSELIEYAPEDADEMLVHKGISVNDLLNNFEWSLLTILNVPTYLCDERETKDLVNFILKHSGRQVWIFNDELFMIFDDEDEIVEKVRVLAHRINDKIKEIPEPESQRNKQRMHIYHNTFKRLFGRKP